MAYLIEPESDRGDVLYPVVVPGYVKTKRTLKSKPLTLYFSKVQLEELSRRVAGAIRRAD